MKLPIPTSYAPMEARLVDEIPVGEEWEYEPKWDGFRCLAFRDGDRIELMSKSGKPLARYFPDVVEVIAAVRAERFVLDGEIVVPRGTTLSFDDLLMRIHPAERRVRMLAEKTPATYMAFDMLVDGDGVLITGRPQRERRAILERFMKQYGRGLDRLLLSPATSDLEVVGTWLKSVGSGLDGIVAKRADLDYQSGNRNGMRKVKQVRTADCVVGGFRYASKGRVVGSLLLGLYDDAGLLNHVGFTANIPASEKAAVTGKLEQLVEAPGFTGNAPGGPSRWSTERTGEWEPLRPELVVEVAYDHFSGGRFRHGTSFHRWRPDKEPRQCTLEQVKRAGEPALVLV